MTNQELVNQLKSEAALEPFILHPNGRAIQLPKGFPFGLKKKRLTFGKLTVQVGFTWDKIPATGQTFQHLSVSGPDDVTLPEDVMDEIKRLAFGTERTRAIPFKTAHGLAQQWLFEQTTP